MTAVIVTRPAREAAVWVEALRLAGLDAHALPLIDLGPGPDPVQLQNCRQDTQAFDAWMFVSPQAVHAFWAAPGPTPAPGSGPRCWAPGPGTARALTDQGVPPACIDLPDLGSAQFDSEALWATVQPQVGPGHRLLIVHGVSSDGHAGRDWLARQCEQAGGSVSRCVAYRRTMPVWSAAEQAQVQGWARSGASWLFSSSEAVQHLAQLCPGQDWSRARAVATHPRIADVAQRLGFGQVTTCRPALPDVIHTLESGNTP